MISAIIPARNEEASIARTVESVAAQPEFGEVIVVNDQSTDATGAILDQLRQRIGKLRVMNLTELPAGWVGKNRAVWQGAAGAHGDWLLFTDADTFHLPGSAARALADAAAYAADMVSYSPEQELKTWWEKAMVPVVYWRLSQRYSFERVNDERAPDAAANGQYILMRREAYFAIGGHEGVKGEIPEDVALARAAKVAGYRLYFAPGQGMVQTRMYRSWGTMWQGWTKNLYPLFGGNLGDALLEIEAAGPWLGLLLGLAFWSEAARHARADWLLAAIAAVLFARPWAWYEWWLRLNHYPAGYIRYYLPGVAMYAAAMVASWWKSTRGAVQWKGRSYAKRQKLGSGMGAA